MKRNRPRPAAWPLLAVLLLIGVGCNSAWVSSGILYQDQGNYEKAEEVLRTGLTYNPDDAANHYYLAMTLVYRAENDHMAEGEVDSARIKLAEAYDHYQRAMELDPETYEFNPDAEREEDQRLAESGINSIYARLFNKGVELMRGEQEQEAIQYFDLASTVDPRGEHYFDAQFMKLQLRYNEAVPEGEVADEDEVEDILQEFEKLEVGDWEEAKADRKDLVNVKAQLYKALGQPSKANALYEELLADNPDDRTLLQRVAQARIEEGDREGAHELYSRAVDLVAQDPDATDDDRFAVAYRAISNAIQGELYSRAISTADRAEQWAISASDRSRLARAKARSYYQLEEFDRAVSTIEPVVEDGGLDPTSVDGWQIYYLALNKIGRETEAMEARERYQELRGAN